MIEIQVHPGNIRKRVKYFFLKRNHILVLGVVSTFVASFFAWALIIAPGGFTSHQTRLSFSESLAQRTRLLTEAKNMSTRAQELSTSLNEQRQMLEKFFAIYNISIDSSGQGGLPEIQVPDQVDGFDRLDYMDRKLKQQVAVSTKLLEELTAYEKENRSIVSLTPTICPLPRDTFLLTSPFGNRINPFTRKQDYHQGLDFAAPSGTPVMATADGKVSFAGRYPLRKSAAWWRYGNIVVLNHGDNFMTIYAHLDKALVKNGQKVSRGQTVGEVGNSGWSTSPHLHYEIRTNLVNGQTFVPVDPRIYILDHHWSNMDQILIAARGNTASNYEPIPTTFRR
ncbi:MAG TPA: M23 family metallopeptidase [Thermoanaerobaculia bacterium]|nr:M23 family metallopeptidase [Thermoanaerobaculia bacterium]HUM31050.1 M23 family metallopeptidase [Thermoanaerobaculia bacterium]HXK69348.1 M23 family metallopeptidase [Thermoanaerobaculia bacterium]